MCKLSIVIPVYNTSRNLRKCIDSILIQLKENIEIVAVNDGSTDNCDEILQEYVKQYPEKILYYKKENTGVADTRNFGISKSNGKYILFVDSDDYIKEGLIEELLKYIEQDIDIIKFKLEKVNEQGQVLEEIEGPVFGKETGEDGFNKLVFIDNLIDSPCVYVFKKELFVENDLFFRVGTEHEDFGLIPLILLLAKSMVSLEIYGYNYIQTDNSITRNDDYKKTIKKFEDTLLHYDNMIQFIEKINIKKETKENIKTYYTNAVLLKLATIKKEDRKPYIKQIRERKMIKNIKPKDLKQLFKRILLILNINYYLKLRK